MRLFPMALALLALPAAALAQDAQSCRIAADVARDHCMRASGGDIYASRACQTAYLTEQSRCQRLQLRQIPQQVQPPQPPPRIGPPPIQPVQPPAMPRLNR